MIKSIFATFIDSNDTDYQLTADMMIHDIDDERTIEEEEMMESSEDFSSEVNNLQKVDDFSTQGCSLDISKYFIDE